jgi:hypothetical protein
MLGIHVCAGTGTEDALWPLHPGVLRLCYPCRVCLLLCCWGFDWGEGEHTVAVLLEGNGIFSSAVVDPRLAMA